MARQLRNNAEELYFFKFFPNISIFPRYSLQMPQMAFRVVDFPAPLPPTMANTLPWGTARETPFSTSGLSFS